jgi:hypothetical protein
VDSTQKAVGGDIEAERVCPRFPVKLFIAAVQIRRRRFSFRTSLSVFIIGGTAVILETIGVRQLHCPSYKFHFFFLQFDGF